MGREPRGFFIKFLKTYYLDFTVFLVGGILSFVLDWALGDAVAIVGIIATIFVETVLLVIRKEVHKIIEELVHNNINQIAQDLHRITAITDVVTFVQKMEDKQYELAVEAELARARTAFNELEEGKRRIYKKEELYDEQEKVIESAKKSLLTIHVVHDIEDLYQWDPKKMNKESGFYSVLYKAYESILAKPLEERRRVVVLPEKSLGEIKNTYINSEKNKQKNKRKAKMPEENEQIRRTKQYYESIESIVKDQKRLNFEVRFITTARAVAAQRAIFDCIISDTSHLFEFSKADSMDVRAYVINGQDYIQKRVNDFHNLWEESEKWE